MTDCTDPRWNELLGAYALGACTPDEQAGLREHMSHCPTCTAELLELGTAREALLTSVPRAASPPELKSRVMQQVRADAELFTAAKAREGGRAPQAQGDLKPERRGRFGWLRRPIPLAVAGACAVVLAVGGVLGGRSSAARTAARRPRARCRRRSTPRRRRAPAAGSSSRRPAARSCP